MATCAANVVGSIEAKTSGSSQLLTRASTSAAGAYRVASAAASRPSTGSNLEPSDSNNTIMTTHTDLMLTPSPSNLPEGTNVQPQLTSRGQHEVAADLLNPANDDSNCPVSISTPAKQRRNYKDKEPVCVRVFKWSIIGLLMLAVVLYFMGDVMYAWFSGDLAIKHKEQLAAISTPSSNLTTESD